MTQRDRDGHRTTTSPGAEDGPPKGSEAAPEGVGGTGSATNLTPGQTDGHSGSQTGNRDGLQSGNQRDSDLGTQPGSRSGGARKPGPAKL